MHRIDKSPNLYKFSRKENNNSIYNLKLDLNTSKPYREYTFGTSSLSGKHKNVMLVGATGSGKTTLINGMINYILNVKREDPVRFELIPKESTKSEAHSQTSEITAYQINHCKDFAIDNTLTIIDTPGFGDTRGIEKDREIVDMVRQLFSEEDGISSIDAVGFVVQSALPRLTATQRYIFDSILSIFGKDIEQNIVLLATFADGQTPQVLQAIQEADVPCAHKDDGTPIYFKFNNSALFASNSGAKVDDEDEEKGQIDEVFWNMGMGSLKNVFTYLGKMETRSLLLTKEVLEERKTLETAVQGLLPIIQVGLTKLDEVKKTQIALEKHWDCAKENKDFEYEVDAIKIEKIDLSGSGIHTTACTDCNFTCHDDCACISDMFIWSCSAMNWNVSCKICPGKCFWKCHHKVQYKIVYSTIKKKETYHILKEKFEKARGKTMTAAQVFQKLADEYTTLQQTVLDYIKQLSESQRRLGEIALRPNPLAAPDYIDLMMESEKREGNPGFMERIEELQRVREGAVILKKVSDKETLLPDEKTNLEKWTKQQCDKVKGVFTNVTTWFSKKV